MNTRLICLTAVLITLIIVAAPFYERSLERELRERELAVKERQVNVLMIEPLPLRLRL